MAQPQLGGDHPFQAAAINGSATMTYWSFDMIEHLQNLLDGRINLPTFGTMRTSNTCWKEKFSS